MSKNNQKEIGDLAFTYVYRDALANKALGVDIQGDFYIAALLSDIEGNTKIQIEDEHEKWIRSILDFLCKSEDFIKHSKKLGPDDAMRYTMSLQEISESIKKLQK